MTLCQIYLAKSKWNWKAIVWLFTIVNANIFNEEMGSWEIRTVILKTCGALKLVPKEDDEIISVRSVQVCLELSIFIFLAQILKLLSQLSTSLLALSLSEYSARQTEPKILRLVMLR